MICHDSLVLLHNVFREYFIYLFIFFSPYSFSSSRFVGSLTRSACCCRRGCPISFVARRHLGPGILALLRLRLFKTLRMKKKEITKKYTGKSKRRQLGLRQKPNGIGLQFLLHTCHMQCKKLKIRVVYFLKRK